MRIVARPETFGPRTLETPILGWESNVPEARSSFDKLDAHIAHSQWIRPLQIDHSTGDFFVCRRVSQPELFIYLYVPAQRYERPVRTHHKCFDFLGSC